MKIAIVKLSALGDIIHAMVVLQFIKKHHPETVIDWVVEEAFKGVLENNPHINQIHTVKFQQAKKTKSLLLLLNELRKIRRFGQYDLVIDTQGLVKSALVARLIPSLVTLGFNEHSLRESFAAKFYSKTFQIDYSNNVIERNLTIVGHELSFSFDANDIVNKRPFLHTSKAYVFHLLSMDKKNIVLIPGASFPSKCYPFEKFAQLTLELDANYLVVWGNEMEKNIADEIKGLSTRVSIMPKLSLDELMSLISQVDLVIGSDTGPTHMAWALNTPSITLFGPTPGCRNTYATDINRIIESKSKVNPLKIDKNDFSIKDIEVSDIVKLSKELLLENK